MTSMGGLRESILPSHDLAGTPLRLAHRTTLLAATISSRRRVRSPMRDVRPRRSLPPVDLCTGVRPTQAAKSRPDRNVSGAGASASMAVAINGEVTAAARAPAALSLDINPKKFPPASVHPYPQGSARDH